MIRSMTGFAAVSREATGEQVHVTVKSVNHRFLDVVVKMPHALAGLDGRVRALAQQRLTRGRVEISISAEVTTPPAREVVIDEALLDQVATALNVARTRGTEVVIAAKAELERVKEQVQNVE